MSKNELMVLHSYFAIPQAPLCGRELASIYNNNMYMYIIVYIYLYVYLLQL